MDTQRINFLLSQPSEAREDDLYMVEQAIRMYPYSQLLHILRSKISHELNTMDHSRMLGTSAIYASSRSVLKQVIQGDKYLEKIPQAIAYQKLPLFKLEADEENTGNEDAQTKELASSDIFKEVIKNLQKLKALREQFLFLESEPFEEKQEKETNLHQAKSPDETIPEKTVKTKKSNKPKKEDKKEKIEAILQKDLELDSKVNEYFIREIIQKSDPQPEPVKEKKNLQDEIIERFIQEQPSIGSIKKEFEKSPDEITKDLSEQSTRFGDDLVSENLAVILLKQGKKEKAIDIYRKLIWKLPQKKAYFAARIEEINK